MNPLYLYAIGDRVDRTLPAVAGLEGVSLANLAYQGLAAVVSPVTATAVETTHPNLWHHETIIEKLMADRSLLPVRFGTILPHEAAVRALLETHYTNFMATLERVRGRIEVGLRVLWDEERRESPSSPSCPSQGPAVQTGRAYLLARLEEERRTSAHRQRAEAVATAIHSSLTQLAVESVQKILITPRMLLSSAYLLDRKQIDTFLREVKAQAACFPALQLLCTGPWPPYNFVTGCVPEEVPTSSAVPHGLAKRDDWQYMLGNGR